MNPASRTISQSHSNSRQTKRDPVAGEKSTDSSQRIKGNRQQSTLAKNHEHLAGKLKPSQVSKSGTDGRTSSMSSQPKR